MVSVHYTYGFCRLHRDWSAKLLKSSRTFVRGASRHVPPVAHAQKHPHASPNSSFLTVAVNRGMGELWGIPWLNWRVCLQSKMTKGASSHCYYMQSTVCNGSTCNFVYLPNPPHQDTVPLMLYALGITFPYRQSLPSWKGNYRVKLLYWKSRNLMLSHWLSGNPQKFIL